MQTVQGNRIESLRAVLDFVTEHADRFPDVPRSGTFRKLASLVERVALLAEQQAANRGAGQGETQLVHAARDALVQEHLIPIVRMSHILRAEGPDLAVVRLPDERLGAAKLASAAHQVATVAEAHADRFVALGLAPDFPIRLRQAIERMIDAIDERAMCRGRRAGATAGLRKLLRLGRRYVLVLDAFIRTSAKGDAALLAGWDAVSHARRVATRRRAAAPAVVLDEVKDLHVQILRFAQDDKKVQIPRGVYSARSVGAQDDNAARLYLPPAVMRISPSCATDATNSPEREWMVPRTKPLAPLVTGLSVE
jgi:hypothetical protein